MIARASRLAFPILAAAACCAAVYFSASAGLKAAGAPAGPAALYTVRRGTVRMTVNRTGAISSRRSEKVKPGIPYGAKIIELVPEGTIVRKGEVLCRLDTADLDRLLTEKDREIGQQAGRINSLAADLEIEKAEFGLSGRRAELGAREAEGRARSYIEVENLLMERSKAVQVEDAEAAYRRARERLLRMPSLLADGFASPEEAWAAEAEERRSELGFLRASNELDMFVEYARPIETARLKNASGASSSTLEAERKRLRVKLSFDELHLFNERKRLEDLLVEFDKLREYKAMALVRSPADGIVIYGDTDEDWWRDEEIKVGRSVWGDEVLMTIPDMSELHALIKVPESSIYMLKAGQPATVRVRCGGLKVLEGRIEKISELASSGDWFQDAGVKEFDVEVFFSAQSGMLRPRLTAEIEIAIGAVDGVLFVPEHAVRKEGGRTYCWTWSNGALLKTDVRPGVSGGGFTEIKGGLSEGDSVYLGLPQSFETGEETGGGRGEAGRGP